MDVSDERLVESGWTIVNGALRTFVNSSRLAELGGSDEGLRRARPHRGRRRHDAAGADRDRLLAHAARADRRVHADQRVRHRDGRGPGRQGIRLVRHHAARALHGRGRRGRGPGGDRRDGRRARALRTLHGRLRPPAGGRHHEQPHRAGVQRGGVLRLRHAVPRTARRHGGLAATVDLRPRRDAGPGGLQGHHLRRPAHRPHRSHPSWAAHRLSGELVQRAAPAARSRSARQARAPPARSPRPRSSARNGFRFGAGGGRQFDGPPGVAASNVVVEGEEPVSHEELLRTVGDGLYIGRIWYTYPINGPQRG